MVPRACRSRSPPPQHRINTNAIHSPSLTAFCCLATTVHRRPHHSPSSSFLQRQKKRKKKVKLAILKDDVEFILVYIVLCHISCRDRERNIDGQIDKYKEIDSKTKRKARKKKSVEKGRTALFRIHFSLLPASLARSTLHLLSSPASGGSIKERGRGIHTDICINIVQRGGERAEQKMRRSRRVYGNSIALVHVNGFRY